MPNRTNFTCSVEGCLNQAHARTLCHKHYEQWRRTGDPIPGPKKVYPFRGCDVDGCERKHFALGFCKFHYGRLKYYGDARWEREYAEYIDAHGYRIVIRPGHPNAQDRGRIPEHRWVMSEMLGRALLPKEEVHHLNGNRSDNRPSNLELWSTSQPPGQRVQDKVAWALEILDIYGADFVQPSIVQPVQEECA